MDDPPIIIQLGVEPPAKPVPVCASCGTALKHRRCPRCKPRPIDPRAWRAR